MTEEHRDPELESLAAEWSAPAPGQGFRSRVFDAYDQEFGKTPSWRRWPVFAAAAVAAGLLLAFVIVPRGSRYEPVRQPRFVIISQGERP